ncbi:MAG: polysaccharide pyruvyl transferase family protein [Clostridiales bacterium]|nr:polysaccharide pyruvyl transferase family protein [Clostridiales bacterium]
MKVGILSINMYTSDLNWASRIHSYAFQQFLDQHGIDNVIIDYKPNYCNQKFDSRHPFNYYVEHPRKDPNEQEAVLAKWQLLYQEREERYDRIQAFIDRYYRKTDQWYDPNRLDTMDPGCDIYVVATDVVWDYRKPDFGFDRGFFLQSKCMEGKGKIAFSVSRGGGGATFPPEQIQGIDYISLRERTLYEFVRDDCNTPAALTLDPVFLQDAEFYEPLCKKPEESGYVLLYEVMKNSPGLVNRAEKYAREHHLQLIELSEFMAHRYMPVGTEHPVKYGLGIEDWLGYLKYADCVFTNSFHGLSFCLIFQKQFYVGGRPHFEKGTWLLEIFGLTDRWIKAGQPLATGLIDYGPVEELRVKYKERSAQYILDAIEEVSWRLEHPEEAKQTPKKELKGIEDMVPTPPSKPEPKSEPAPKQEPKPQPEPAPKPPQKPKPLWKRALRKVKRLLS